MIRTTTGMFVMLAATLLTNGTAAAGTIVLTLDPGTIPAGIMCGETWTEAGAVLSFVPTLRKDCGPDACFFSQDGIWLFPARLNVDLSAFAGQIVSAEVDVDDACGVSCTRAFMYAGAAIVDSDQNAGGAPETLTLSAGAAIVDRLAVSSCEGMCTEIRIEVENSADIDGDGTVDVEDLVLLILDWGCMSPPDTCPGDVNGDGIVDVQDLVDLILSWD